MSQHPEAATQLSVPMIPAKHNITLAPPIRTEFLATYRDDFTLYASRAPCDFRRFYAFVVKDPVHPAKHVVRDIDLTYDECDSLELIGLPICVQHDQDRVVGVVTGKWRTPRGSVGIDFIVYDTEANSSLLDLMESEDLTLYKFVSLYHDVTHGTIEERVIEAPREISIVSVPGRSNTFIFPKKHGFVYKMAALNALHPQAEDYLLALWQVEQPYITMTRPRYAEFYFIDD